MFTLILSCLLLQYPADPVRGAEQAQLLIQAHARALAAAAQQEKVLQRHSSRPNSMRFLRRPKRLRESTTKAVVTCGPKRLLCARPSPIYKRNQHYGQTTCAAKNTDTPSISSCPQKRAKPRPAADVQVPDRPDTRKLARMSTWEIGPAGLRAEILEAADSQREFLLYKIRNA